ncbi:MAG: hypothetical protein ACK2UH_11400 [Candidatus Promineifilaceae bacterium]
MSDTLSHLAATTLGSMPAIGPGPAAFFAPLARPPAASLAEAMAALRVSPTNPPSPSPIVPAVPPLVRDPALIDRSAPSLRRLVQATTAAGDLITPLSSWSPPLIEGTDPDPAAVDAKSPGSAVPRPPAGQRSTADRLPLQSTETMSPTGQEAQSAPMVDPTADKPVSADPVPAQQRQPDESADLEPARPALVGPISEPAGATGLRRPGSAAAEPETIAHSQPAPPLPSDPVKTVRAAAEPAPGKTRSAASIRPAAFEARRDQAAQQPPDQAIPAIAPGPEVAGTAVRPDKPTPPDSIAPAPFAPAPIVPDSITPDSIVPDPVGSDPAPGIASEQAKSSEPVRPDLVAAVSEPIEPPPGAAGPTLRPAEVQSNHEMQANAAGPDSSIDLLPASALAGMHRPVQAAAEQGQAAAKQSQVLAGQGSSQSPQETRQPTANLERFRATTPVSDQDGIRPTPGQPAPVENAAPGQRPAATKIPIGRSRPVAQASQASPTIRPAHRPEPGDAPPALPPPARPGQPGRPQSPSGQESGDIWPDIAPPIQPESPAAPARPTIEITIGRVEVRLRSDATRPPQPAPRPKPALSLDDYLSRQGGR